MGFEFLTAHALDYRLQQVHQGIPMKQALPLDELKRVALKNIREHRLCYDVEDLSICPIMNGNAYCDWAISCGVGGSNKIAASKAAFYVQEEMRRSCELLNEDAVA
jgi:hypothetical protein